MKILPTFVASLLALASISAVALDDASRARLEHIQSRWAEIHYDLRVEQREAAFSQLAKEAEDAIAAEPQAAELRIWHGIVLSTWAGAKGGFGALRLVKQAKAELEQSLQLDPKALAGSAWTSLGSLYYQVPGWPVGFGDDAKAEDMLRTALAINPDGIDPNYCYGDFLVRKERYAEAKAVLEKALAAPSRAGRARADEGRRAEARKLLEAVQARLQ